MRPDQMPRQAFEGALEPLDAEMSNAALADAIKYAFECCSKTYAGGDCGRDTGPGKLMLDHLSAVSLTYSSCHTSCGEPT